ncbi:reverse transcriptase domain-containing protein [Tanacetum coccineum]
MMAEYEALLAGLRIARMMNVLWIEVKVDSKLVASQINGMYEASNGSMIKYLAKAREYISEFKTFSIENIPRGKPLQANYVIREIHMGSYGMHVGPRAVVRKAMRQGYLLGPPCIRAKKTWGMDILGSLTPARGGAKFVIVAIDYFTKWVEAKPLVKITGKEMNPFRDGTTS